MLLLLLIILLCVVLAGGGWYGYGPGPLGLVFGVLIALILLWALGLIR